MKSYTYIFIVFLLFLSTIMLMAQPGGGGPSTPTPIDGGIGLLIAAAVAYGGKKAYDKKKES